MKARKMLAVLPSLLYLVVLATPTVAQQPVRVVVAPDRADWTYHIAEKANFEVLVFRFGNPVQDVEVEYEVKPEKMAPIRTGQVKVQKGHATVGGFTMKQPGFLRCWATVSVDGVQYRGLGTAGFDPLDIKPTAELPSDFVEFWDSAKRELAEIPIDAKMTLRPERCTSKVNVYEVSLANYPNKRSRIYGILCIPKAKGIYPAILEVPGAGVRPYTGDVELAARGVLTFQIGIHGIPVTYQRGLYNDLRAAALRGYWFYNLDDKDRYYYKRVYLGCVRAVDFIVSLPQFDGRSLAVMGGSQGGALSIVTASLDQRIRYLAAFYPALCDLTGYLYNRAGGWPHMFDESNKAFNAKPDKIETSKYYDVVNFARFVKVPGVYSWGFNDTTCPPTSMYAAYNVIEATKKLWLYLDTGHWRYPEQNKRVENWIVEKLTGAR